MKVLLHYNSDTILRLPGVTVSSFHPCVCKKLLARPGVNLQSFIERIETVQLPSFVPLHINYYRNIKTMLRLYASHHNQDLTIFHSVRIRLTAALCGIQFEKFIISFTEDLKQTYILKEVWKYIPLSYEHFIISLVHVSKCRSDWSLTQSNKEQSPVLTNYQGLLIISNVCG